ncbi:hypothetical protein K474DRAFT_1692658 [Panus rudis PR-1116 ss-1]|nr:hypothetical protein K474DRAFT_1692658 [Panus rudis PR-1116 ss-1]
MQLGVASLLVVALAAVQGVRAQGTNATCSSEFRWMSNSRGQSPCLVAAYLNTPYAFVFALPPGFHYRTPIPETATACQCSSVFFNVLQACALCQNGSSVPYVSVLVLVKPLRDSNKLGYRWSTWNTNCTDAIYVQVYPHDIPIGTSVPAWAYLDDTMSDNFNVTAAKALSESKPPDSSALPSPTSNTSSATSSSTPTVAPVAGSSSGKKTNVGAIVGGVIAGVVVLALIAGAAFWFIRKRKAGAREGVTPAQYDAGPNTNGSGGALSTPFEEKIEPGVPYGSPTVPTLTSTPSPAPPVFAQPQPQFGKIYDPNDPSTFPVMSPEPSLSPTAFSTTSPYEYPQGGAGYQPVQPQQQFASGRYSGVPEL